jgi:hypothetical protein
MDMLNGNGALDTSTHRLLDRVIDELASLRGNTARAGADAPGGHTNEPDTDVRLHARFAGGVDRRYPRV